MNILILPGWCLPRARYDKLKKLLEKKGHTVRVVDFPGFEKKLVKPLELSDYVTFIREYIKQHAISNPVIIAHSFGARVALRLLSTYPKTSTILILTGAPGYRTDSSLKIKLFRLLAKTGKPVVRMFFHGGLVPIFSKTLYFIAGNFDYYKADKHLKTTFQNIVNESLVGDMKAIIAKTYLLWGKDDTITPLWIGKKMENTMRHAQLITIEKAGHNVPFKLPDKFVAALDTIGEL